MPKKDVVVNHVKKHWFKYTVTAALSVLAYREYWTTRAINALADCNDLLMDEYVAENNG